jgi:hypothetical protein
MGANWRHRGKPHAANICTGEVGPAEQPANPAKVDEGPYHARVPGWHTQLTKKLTPLHVSLAKELHDARPPRTPPPAPPTPRPGVVAADIPPRRWAERRQRRLQWTSASTALARPPRRHRPTSARSAWRWVVPIPRSPPLSRLSSLSRSPRLSRTATRLPFLTLPRCRPSPDDYPASPDSLLGRHSPPHALVRIATTAIRSAWLIPTTLRPRTGRAKRVRAADMRTYARVACDRRCASRARGRHPSGDERREAPRESVSNRSRLPDNDAVAKRPCATRTRHRIVAGETTEQHAGAATWITERRRCPRSLFELLAFAPTFH